MDESMQLKRRVAPSFSEQNIPLSDSKDRLEGVKLSKAEVAAIDVKSNPKVIRATTHTISQIADLFSKAAQKQDERPQVRMG